MIIDCKHCRQEITWGSGLRDWSHVTGVNRGLPQCATVPYGFLAAPHKTTCSEACLCRKEPGTEIRRMF